MFNIKNKKLKNSFIISSFLIILLSFYLVFGERISTIFSYEKEDPDVKTPHEYKKDFSFNKLTNINVPNDIYELTPSEFMEKYNNGVENFTLHDRLYDYFEWVNLKKIHKIKLFHHEKSNSFFLFNDENKLLRSYEIIDPNEYYKIRDYFTFQFKRLSKDQEGYFMNDIFLKNYEGNNILSIEYSMLDFLHYDMILHFTNKTISQYYHEWMYKNALYFLFLSNNTQELNFPNILLDSDASITYKVKNINNKEYVTKSFENIQLDLQTFKEHYKPKIIIDKTEYENLRLLFWIALLLLSIFLNILCFSVFKVIDKRISKNK